MEILRKAIVVIIALMSVATFGCVAQITKKVEMILGEWTISNDITPIQARAHAIGQAKAEALRMAGSPEYVAESSVFYKTEREKNQKEIYKSVTSIDIVGEISGFEIVKEEKKLNEFGDLKYQVWINASVILHATSRDAGFNLEVTGIRESYSSPEELIFEVVPSREGFLNIFILGDHESLLLYPNKLEKRDKLEGRITHKFPSSRALDYEVSTEESMEVNYVVLLYTKSEIPFVGEATSENILQFIAAIDPDQKCIKSYPILIRKQ